MDDHGNIYAKYFLFTALFNERNDQIYRDVSLAPIACVEDIFYWNLRVIKNLCGNLIPLG
jgi:hypothetical protein